MKAAEEVYKKAYEEEMKKQQAAGAGQDTNAAGSAETDVNSGNPGDDVVDGDFKEV